MKSELPQIAFTIFLVTFFGSFLTSSQAYTFYVGGKDGWVLKPKEDYNHWAERNRFQINDTLIFRFKNGYDDVLEVNKDDYYKCYKEKPLQALKDGNSTFKFDRSGPFCFISGHADNCEKGQRLIIVVLHPRGNNSNKAPSPVIAKSPTPSPAAGIIIPPPSPTPEIPHNLTPAPAPSAATFSGVPIGSLLGLSLLIIVTCGYLF